MLFGGMRAILAITLFDLFDADLFLALFFRHDKLGARPGLVDDINRFVGQLPVRDMAYGQIYRALNGRRGE